MPTRAATGRLRPSAMQLRLFRIFGQGEDVPARQVLPLDGRALDILIYLADRPGEVIAKRDAPQDDLSKGR